MEKVKKWNMQEVGKKIMSPFLKHLSPKEQEKAFEKMLGALNLIRIEPQRMVLRKYNTDFSTSKYEWKSK